MEENKQSLSLFFSTENIAFHSLFYLFSSVGPALFQIFLVFFLARYISPAKFGNFMLVYSALTLLVLTVTAWIDGSNLRFYAVYEGTKDYQKFFSTVFASLFLLLFAVSGLLLLLAVILKERLTSGMWSMISAGILAMPFYGIIFSGSVFLQSAVRPRAYAFLRLAFFLLSFLLGIFFILRFNYNPNGIFFAWIVAGVILLPFLLKTVSFGQNFRIKEIKMDLLREIFIYGAPFIATKICWLLPGNIERYLLRIFKGASEVGLYSTGWALSNKALLFFSFLTAATYPLVCKCYEEEGKDSVPGFLRGLVRIYFLFSFPLVILLSGLARDIFTLFLNSAYQSGYILLPFITLGTFFFGLGQYTSKGLILEKKTNTYLWVVASFAALNLLLNFLLIPFFGMLGASIAYLLANFYFAVAVKVKSDYFLPFALPWKSLNRIITSAIFSAVVIFLLHQLLPTKILFFIVKSLIGLATYLFALLVLGEIRTRNVLRVFRYIGRGLAYGYSKKT